eukprot:m.59958 g.59958  ORF g.59958 m.59958 type:complete len:99 (+) comp7926_c0_seq1:30-326(+)
MPGSFDHEVDPASGAAVHVVPALSDNFMYLIVCTASNVAAVVDPVEPDKLIAKAKEVGAQITTILTTHNHVRHALMLSYLRTTCPCIAAVLLVIDGKL